MSDIIDWILGLDIGKQQDYTALVLLERRRVRSIDNPPPAVPHLDVVFAKRFELLTPYPIIVSYVKEFLESPQFVTRPSVALDATGCGAAIADLFLYGGLQANVYPILITGGNTSHETRWNNVFRSFNVCKPDLIGCVQSGLGSGRLKCVPSLGLAEIIRRELVGFRMRKSPAGNDILEHRSGQHDDLILAIALGTWLASKLDMTDIWIPKDGVAAVEDPSCRRDSRVYGTVGTDQGDEWHRRGVGDGNQAAYSRTERRLIR